MENIVLKLDREFKKASSREVAHGQKAYMKNQFEFYGIKTPQRRSIQKHIFIKNTLPSKSELESLIKALWNKPEREYQYAGQELVKKYTKMFEPDDMYLLEFMIINKSWWDTVDYIASKLVGDIFLLYPELRDEHVNRWLQSENMWLQRSTLLFQLHYKDHTDRALLASIIYELKESDQFFIKKAIGWILREYSKTDPEWVRDFAHSTPLKQLSYREATRRLN